MSNAAQKMGRSQKRSGLFPSQLPPAQSFTPSGFLICASPQENFSPTLFFHPGLLPPLPSCLLFPFFFLLCVRNHFLFLSSNFFFPSLVPHPVAVFPSCPPPHPTSPHRPLRLFCCRRSVSPSPTLDFPSPPLSSPLFFSWKSSHAAGGTWNLDLRRPSTPSSSWNPAAPSGSSADPLHGVSSFSGSA